MTSGYRSQLGRGYFAVRFLTEKLISAPVIPSAVFFNEIFERLSILQTAIKNIF